MVNAYICGVECVCVFVRERERNMEKKSVEMSKGMNDLDKVILREIRGSSVEVCFYTINFLSDFIAFVFLYYYFTPLFLTDSMLLIKQMI